MEAELLHLLGDSVFSKYSFINQDRGLSVVVSVIKKKIRYSTEIYHAVYTVYKAGDTGLIKALFRRLTVFQH